MVTQYRPTSERPDTNQLGGQRLMLTRQSARESSGHRGSCELPWWVLLREHHPTLVLGKQRCPPLHRMAPLSLPFARLPLASFNLYPFDAINSAYNSFCGLCESFQYIIEPEHGLRHPRTCSLDQKLGGLVWVGHPLTSQLTNSLTFFLHVKSTAKNSFHTGSASVKRIPFLLGAQRDTPGSLMCFHNPQNPPLWSRVVWSALCPGR